MGLGNASILSKSAEASSKTASSSTWTRATDTYPRLERSVSDDVVPVSAPAELAAGIDSTDSRPPPSPLVRTLSTVDGHGDDPQASEVRSRSPPPLPPKAAVDRAVALSEKLSSSNIRSQVNESGDLMLDMTGYKTSDEEALRAEVVARRFLAEEIQGHYDIGALIGADEHGNLWVYTSEEAKEAANRRSAKAALTSDSASDPGYQARSTEVDLNPPPPSPHGPNALSGDGGLITPPQTPPDDGPGAESKCYYAKTLRLTSEQLKSLNLRPGGNSMRFSVNKTSCTAHMYFWKYDAPIVISDIDGTITK